MAKLTELIYAEAIRRAPDLDECLDVKWQSKGPHTWEVHKKGAHVTIVIMVPMASPFFAQAVIRSILHAAELRRDNLLAISVREEVH